MAGKIIDEDVLKLTVQNLTQLIADHVFEEEGYTPEEVESFFNCTPEQLQFYESIINPDIVSETRLWASKTISDKIQEAIVQANEYSDDLIKDISSIQLEWCETSLPTTGESNKIYILPTAVDSNVVNTLNIWNTKTSAYVSIGNLDISLDGYVKTEDMNTALSTKANDSEVLKLDKVLTTTTNATNDSVLSAKIVVDELDLKANDSEVIKKTNISTTIDSTSTNDTLPTNKAIYDNIIKNKLGNLILDYTYKDSDSMNITLEHFGAYKFSSPTKGVPSYNVGDWVLINIPWGLNNNLTSMRYANQLLFSPRFEGFWHRTVWNYDSSTYTYTEGEYSIFRKWETVCTTSNKEVGVTTITFTDSTKYTIYGSSLNNYIVKNGMCYVSLDISVVSKQTDWTTVYATMPKPMVKKIDISHSFVDEAGDSWIGYGVWEDGTLKIKSGANNIRYLCNFSYPVAEE